MQPTREHALQAAKVTMFDKNLNGSALVSVAGNFIAANENFCKLVQYSELELLRITWQQITLPEDLDDDEGNVNRLIDGKVDSYEMFKHYIGKQREIIKVRLRVDAVRDERGKLICLYSQVTTAPGSMCPPVMTQESFRLTRFLAKLQKNWPIVLWILTGLAAFVGYVIKTKEP